jgi:hypothetical protein
VTAVQLALTDCDPTWQPQPRRGRRLREREKHDLRGQGLTNRQLDHIRTIRVKGDYL